MSHTNISSHWKASPFISGKNYSQRWKYGRSNEKINVPYRISEYRNTCHKHNEKGAQTFLPTRQLSRDNYHTEGKNSSIDKQLQAYAKQTNVRKPLYDVYLKTSVRRICNSQQVELNRNETAHGDAREGKWRGKMRMEWVASSLASFIGTWSIQ